MDAPKISLIIIRWEYQYQAGGKCLDWIRKI